jgi:hypothetical protein
MDTVLIAAFGGTTTESAELTQLTMTGDPGSARGAAMDLGCDRAASSALITQQKAPRLPVTIATLGQDIETMRDPHPEAIVRTQIIQSYAPAHGWGHAQSGVQNGGSACGYQELSAPLATAARPNMQAVRPYVYAQRPGPIKRTVLPRSALGQPCWC